MAIAPTVKAESECAASALCVRAWMEDRMETSHVSALQHKHAGLERQLEQELNRPLPDPVLIQQLKKRKLRIKEELSHI